MINKYLPKHRHKDDEKFIMHYLAKIRAEYGLDEMIKASSEYGKKYYFLSNGLLSDPKRENMIPRKKCNEWLRRYYASLNDELK